MIPRRNQRGLSLLEFTLATLIVAVLVLLAFERISAVQSDMERAQVRHTVAAMRSALALRFAELAVQGKLERVDDLDGANALALLSPAPAGYRGERGPATDAEVTRGSWYYAPESGVVVYRPRNAGAFPDAAGTPGNERLYWRASVMRDAGRGGRYDSRAAKLELIRASDAGEPLFDHNNS